MENKLRKFIYLVGSVLEIFLQVMALIHAFNNNYGIAIFCMTLVILLDIQIERLEEKN